MHPHAHPEGQWPLWVGSAVQKLTGYTLRTDHALDTAASVDRSHRVINVLPNLSTEQVLAAILVSFVYIKTGDHVMHSHDRHAKVIPFPLRPLGGDGSYHPD